MTQPEFSTFTPESIARRRFMVGAAGLTSSALEMAGRVLKPGGHALIKAFQGSGFAELLKEARDRFGRVKLLKPEASRARSPEMYLLAMQFRLV